MISQDFLNRAETTYFDELPKLLKIVGWAFLVLVLIGLIVAAAYGLQNVLPVLKSTALLISAALSAIFLSRTITNRSPLTLLFAVALVVSASSLLMSPEKLSAQNGAVFAALAYVVNALEILVAAFFLWFTFRLWRQGKFDGSGL